jgi:hypothetical protein
MTTTLATEISNRIDEHVPRKIRAFAEWFCEFYGIDSLCDPMYVCNVVAVMRGEGDGHSFFFEQNPDDAHKPDEIAKRLFGAYSTSIKQSGERPGYILDALKTIDAKPRRLTCCCCGERTTGRQWWNRDTGYGLCSACIPLWLRHGLQYLTSTNGIRGIHFDID